MCATTSLGLLKMKTVCFSGKLVFYSSVGFVLFLSFRSSFHAFSFLFSTFLAISFVCCYFPFFRSHFVRSTHLGDNGVITVRTFVCTHRQLQYSILSSAVAWRPSFIRSKLHDLHNSVAVVTTCRVCRNGRRIVLECTPLYHKHGVEQPH